MLPGYRKRFMKKLLVTVAVLLLLTSTLRAEWKIKHIEPFDPHDVLRYDTLPVSNQYSPVWRAIFSKPVPQAAPCNIVEAWVEVHGSNEGRGRRSPLAWVTELRLETNTDHVREGWRMNHDSGRFNVTADAHHALIGRNGSVQIPCDAGPGPYYIVLHSHVKTVRVQPGDRFELTRDRVSLTYKVYEQVPDGPGAAGEAH
jgi:hypothetical protein